MSPSAVESVSQLPVQVVSSGKATSHGLLEVKRDAASQDELVLKTFRCFIADLCEQFKGGHPG
jgi:dihydroxyacetone synthase